MSPPNQMKVQDYYCRAMSESLLEAGVICLESLRMDCQTIVRRGWALGSSEPLNALRKSNRCLLFRSLAMVVVVERAAAQPLH